MSRASYNCDGQNGLILYYQRYDYLGKLRYIILFFFNIIQDNNNNKNNNSACVFVVVKCLFLRVTGHSDSQNGIKLNTAEATTIRRIEVINNSVFVSKNLVVLDDQSTTVNFLLTNSEILIT